MKLIELEAHFLKLDRNDMKCMWMIDTLHDADGIIFLCPKCFKENNSSKIGVHSVICWFSGKVPDTLDPKPGRWTPSGTGLNDLTFVPGNPPRSVSVLLIAGCGWHGFVINGEAN